MLRLLCKGMVLLCLGVSPVAMASEFTPIASDCQHTGSGKDYVVGENEKYKQLADVPWGRLRAGDTVRIHWRSTPYREKLLISGNGDSEDPIRICGIPNAKGELPVLEGNLARTPSDLDFGRYIPLQDLGVITIYDRQYKNSPSHITIENLHIQGGHPENQYWTTDAQQRFYGRSSACIWVQEGSDITIRGNVLTGCGNGIFALSKPDNVHALTRNILIEGNHLYGNGVANSDRQHNLYVQAVGATYQFNYFGNNIPSAKGGNLKDRSVDTVIRYNWFDGAPRVMDLVEAQEHGPWVMKVAFDKRGDRNSAEQRAFVAQHEPGYRRSYIYGNLIKNKGSDGGSLLIHYGYDSIPEYTRAGTLYFYNNTIVNLSDRKRAWKTRLFDISTPQETVKAFRNILLFDNESAGQDPSHLHLTRDSGNLELEKNIIPGERQDGKGHVVEKSNMVYRKPPVSSNDLRPLISRKEVIEALLKPMSFESQLLPVEWQFHPKTGKQKRVSKDTPGAHDL